ncbi:MAG TPA: S53 family peptidase [Candidatus Binatia bacterium]|nr:S53 family peptidase [Candidatus Binatia bacterium]
MSRLVTPQRIITIIINLLSLFTVPSAAQPDPNPLLTQPKDRITIFIDDDQRITLRGNTHPLASANYDAGTVRSDFPMERMILTLLPDPAQQESLNQLLESQNAPESPFFHQWLTPREFGERFGLSEGDLAQIAAWLEGHGFEIEEVTAGRRAIVFSGTAGQVQEAFHTSIHTYVVGEEYHHANAKDPEIPAALAQVVGGVVSLHDFYSQATLSSVRKVAPNFTSGSSHYLAPSDFATIYDLGPAYQQGNTGSGQAVAIVARSNIRLADVEQFRSFFSLPVNNPQIIVNGPDPGIYDSGEETEADLDVEWAGAVAKAATIDFVASRSTNSTDGVNLSAQYIVNHNLAPVMSTSFGLCEKFLGSAGNGFWNSLWQQAAAEGITVFVSSGDNGAAGCDSSSASKAANGLGVNGMCSPPYSTCVGGTEFSDTANPALYWSPANSGSQGSALSYIPEVAWNESGYGLWASGGGASSVYAKPAWQSGTGVPADGHRDVPDVALNSAAHDGYLIIQEGGMYVVGGTSAATPSFAGLMALVDENAAARQGNANATLYPLATRQGAGGAAVFHDVTSGNNSVPGQNGFKAGAGYDPVTGLGSVDGSVLVAHWSDGHIVPTFQLRCASSLTVTAGSSSNMDVSVTPGNGFKASVALSVSGLPAGVTAKFTPSAIIPSPGTGAESLSLSAGATAVAKSFTIILSAAGGGVTQKQSITVTVHPR